MKRLDFQRKLKTNPRPIIVDLWAPWCKPCRAMEPAFKLASSKYSGQVDVLKINADESPEVLKFLGVMSIPTVIGFANGKEILRRTGMQSADGLDILFDSTLHQRKPAIMPPTPIGRLIRSVAGIALIVIGWFANRSIILIALGAVLLFSAFYDRCPIYRGIAARVKGLFQRSKEENKSS
ncbi:MAG: thioredoxin domain-containing protein [Anaerolineaceae bacterium]